MRSQTLSGRLKPILPVVAGFCGLMAIGAQFPAFARVLDLALPFFGLIGLGFICGRLFDFGEQGLAWVNVFIIYIALPSLFFVLISKTPIAELLNYRFIACTVGATMIAFALSFAVGMKASGGNIPEAAIQAVAGSYANIGYMGPGLTLAALGAAAAAPVALIFVADTIFLFSALPLLMAVGRNDGQGIGRTALTALIRIVTHPFNVAVAIAVTAAAFSWQPPAAIGRMATLLSGAAAPCALFALGVTVALRPMRRVAPELPALLVIKLIGHPLIVYLLLSMTGGFDRVWAFTAVLMASLPPALNVFVMASQYGVYVERASSAILIGTLTSVVTVTLLLWLITGGLLPVSLFNR
jgi:malonate transporter and related proteins